MGGGLDRRPLGRARGCHPRRRVPPRDPRLRRARHHTLPWIGVGTENLAQPPIEWRGTDTFIQSTGVNGDFGAYDDPDSFYAEHGDNLSGVRAWLYARWIRHVLNRNVARIRARGGEAALATMCCSPKAAVDALAR